MTINFTSISGGKFSFIDNQDIRHAIDMAGRKKIVFLEGYDDQVIFEILFSEKLNQVAFIDTSIVGRSSGGCEKVKKYLENIYIYLSENRFFGIIDRDFKTDNEVNTEVNDPKYNNKLYIFRERYTLENYFIEGHILLGYIKGKSMKNKRLYTILTINIINIINNIMENLITISAGNRTLLDYRKAFLDRNTPCDEKIVIKKILSNLDIKKFQVERRTAVIRWYKYYRNNIQNDRSHIHKYISGKYFFYHFNNTIKELTNQTTGKQINIDIDNAKDNLAHRLKDGGLPTEFHNVISFLGL
ncbi:DUF4435 [Desulfonema limicola]|uniref:DUF4435 n=1 Tax=Desulfonema limicola TaxID=45656 RepID=A0A975BBJ1_9BACT|nr:DUF4435 domain-containing protein [Desulfonema limicola]QTA82210.1 DUF4435 [Desulfonema limicola]